MKCQKERYNVLGSGTTPLQMLTHEMLYTLWQCGVGFSRYMNYFICICMDFVHQRITTGEQIIVIVTPS